MTHLKRQLGGQELGHEIENGLSLLSHIYHMDLHKSQWNALVHQGESFLQQEGIILQHLLHGHIPGIHNPNQAGNRSIIALQGQ